MKKQKLPNPDFQRAQNIVLLDKFDFENERFCRELEAFLSERFVYDALNVNVCEGKSNDILLTVDIRKVKKSRSAD